MSYFPNILVFLSVCVTSMQNSRVRRDLEKEGKNDDTSDGEWAEVQLELIRQVGCAY